MRQRQSLPKVVNGKNQIYILTFLEPCKMLSIKQAGMVCPNAVVTNRAAGFYLREEGEIFQ